MGMLFNRARMPHNEDDMTDTLPIDAVLPQITETLGRAGRLVLEAPPGAGKTTRVPLALRDAGFAETGRIILLEPRRLAARAAATRMAETLGQSVGQTVGLRMRGVTETSAATQIEVVTEGILTRMIQSDPELSGVSCVIFDEFHERSLNADMGLALCLDCAAALREDLAIVVMSATLDAGPIAAHINAPIIQSQGRSYPVDVTYLTTPPPPKARIEHSVTQAVLEILPKTEGAVLVFLPGEAEIKRSVALLHDALGESVALRPLYGALPYAEQRRAITPDPTRRKIVLATSIAETSLTISDVRVVIDSGLTRRARFDPASQMSRLMTERVSRAEADQRAGRAGRVAAGTALRLWTKGAHGALSAHRPAEIDVADLTGFVLERAAWTGHARGDLPLLSPPPKGTEAEAIHLLTQLGALSAQGKPTPHATALVSMPLHPRLAHVMSQLGAAAAPICALLSAPDPLRRQAQSVDGLLRLKALAAPTGHSLREIAQEAKRLKARAPKTPPAQMLSPAHAAALAYPDQIAMRRAPHSERYILSGGKGAILSSEDALNAAPFLVVTDHDGHPREAKVRMAFALSEDELREIFADDIAWHHICAYAPRHRKLETFEEERLGALILTRRPWHTAPAEAKARAMLEAIEDLGLPWSRSSTLLAARMRLLPDAPNMDEAHLRATAQDWLLPYLTDITTQAQLSKLDLRPALLARLDWATQNRLAREVPEHYTTPLGRKIAIDYSGDHPEVALRLQEVFGETRHPTVGGRPLRMVLLSPAQRPVQTTLDLPQFWQSSYADVRKDMRGRYPKHPWPEDPTQADPTVRVKRRT